VVNPLAKSVAKSRRSAHARGLRAEQNAFDQQRSAIIARSAEIRAYFDTAQ